MATRIASVLAGGEPVGSRITIEGWIRTRRDSKAGLSFLAVHDGSCFEPLQVVAPAELANYQTDILRITTGCAVRVTGEVVASQGKGQTVELRGEAIEVVGWVDDPDHYPMQPKQHTMEYLREVAHLRARTNIIGAVTRVRHTLAQAVHRFFHERGFFWVHTPIITASDAEGAGQMFRVSTLDASNPPRTPDGQVDFDKDFFGREARLTVSGQLNVETYCLALSKVYTFGPTFRAENSNTRRHLAEFWMIEPEVAFADLAANAQLAEDFLKSIYRVLLDERKDDMAFFEKRVDPECQKRLAAMIESKFERMDYGEAIRVLEKSGQKFEYPVSWGIDLQSEHERYLTEKVIKGPIAVVNYPKDIKAFYMRMNEDGKTVAAMDVLAPGIGEIIGGSQREERLEVLDARIAEMGLHAKDYWWYRDLRRYGTVPHAGFGLGFERAIQYATGIENIRDVIPFPRAPRQAEFLVADWVFAAERAYVAAAVRAAAATLPTEPEPDAPLEPTPEARARAVAAAGAIASRYLAVGTPRSFGIIIEDSTDVELAALALEAHRAWFAPRDLRCAASHGGADELAAAIGGRVVSIDEALACDIANVYAQLTIAPGQLRRGTHVNLNADVTLAAELVATIVHEAGLPALVAGLVDGRQLDELTVFFADGAPIALTAV